MIAMKWKAARGPNGGIVWRWVKVVIEKKEKVLDKKLENVNIDILPG